MRWAAGVVLALWSLLLIAWLTLHWGILPRLDDWRPQIEQRIGAAIGAPLSIGRIRVSSGSWVPALALDDVHLLDRQGRIALALGRVSAALSPASLLALEPRFAQLHLDGVNLDVRLDAAGRLSIGGLDLASGDAAQPGNPAAAEWFLAQHEFVIRRGTLRWTDERQGAPPLTLTGVDLVWRNSRRGHAIRLDATPPADWGQPFQLRGEFTHALGAQATDWQRWRGSLYAFLPEVDVSQLRRHVDLPFEIHQGRGALRTWLQIADGQPVQGTVDVALTAVDLRLASDLPSLALAQLRGRLQASRQPGVLDLSVQDLAFVTDDGVPWAPQAWRLSLQQDPLADPDSPWTAGRLQVDRLDLAPLARLAARLPLPPAVHRGLADLAPQGQVQGLAIDWTGPPQAPATYRAVASARGLALAAGPPGPPAWGLPQTAGRPGLRGADLALDATHNGGTARLTLTDGALVFPGVFEQAELPLDTLSAQLSWRIDPGAAGAPPALSVTVAQADFGNPDVRGTLSGSWRTGPGPADGFGVGQRWPGVVDLQGRLDGGDASRVVRYLPLGIPAATRSYLARAIGPGRITEADLRSQGDLWRFPFMDDGPGTFRVRAQVRDLSYAYIPSEADWRSPWPVLQGVAGEILFERAAMRLRGVQAELAGLQLRGVNGGIADLQQPVLQIDGRASGPLADVLRFVETTPVGGWIGGALQAARATGRAELTLALGIPLHEAGRSTVRGAVQLLGNDLRLQPGTPLLAQSRGRVEFSEQGFKLVGGRTRLLGGDATVEGGSQPDGRLRFNGQGTATAEGLLRARDVPALAPLAALGGRLRGQAPYRLQLDFLQGRPELTLNSSLAGLALDLPAPLAKAAGTAWPLRLQTRLLPEQPAADRLQLDIADVLQAHYERDLAGDDIRVRRGAIGLGTAAPPLPADGVLAAVVLPRLDVDAWRRLAPAAATADAADGQALPSDAWPTRATLRTAEMLIAGRRLDGVALDLRRQTGLSDTAWRADVRADQAEGWVAWRQPHLPGSPGRVSARLSRLDLPEPAAGVDAAAQDWLPQAPASVPALSLVVDDFRMLGVALGRLDVEAENRGAQAGDAAGATEWQLDQLKLSTPDATLLARGLWAAGRRTSLAFDLALADGGRFFERVGAGKAMEGGRGRIEGELSWPGSPLAFDLTTLQGRVAVALGEGRFLNAEPGAARLFGVLSLQALPRRLLLDFSDVFQQGMAFDTIAGDVAVQAGVARTRNLRVLGVQVGVLVEGSADLNTQTQDLRIVAVPELNTTTATLAWAALNPAVGLGAFIAQLLLREPMTAAATREFHVTGPWSAPMVQRVTAVAAAASAPTPGTTEGRTP